VKINLYIKFILTIIFPVFLFQCRTTGGSPAIYKYKIIHNGASKTSLQSIEKIEKEKTYLVNFTIELQEECLLTKITAKPVNSYAGRQNIYFIVEKALDLHKFKFTDNNEIFSELDRNFNNNWERRTDIEICSSGTDPIKKLEPGKYRIRFSSLDNNDFDFEITIQTNKAPVLFNKKTDGGAN
jgi:hypothetical protein